MAQSVVTALRTEGTTGVAVQVNWEGYTYMLHAIHTGAEPVTGGLRERENPNVSLDVYDVGGRELRVVHAIRLTPDSPPTRIVTDLVQAAHRDGFMVFMPVESPSKGLSADALGFEPVVY